MRVCLLPTDNWGVGSYRILFPGRELARQGGHLVSVPRSRDSEGKTIDGPVPVAVGVGEDDEILEWFDADVYVLQRRMEHRTRGERSWSMAAVAEWLRSHGKVVVSDVDDWMPGLNERNPGYLALQKLSRWMSVEGMLDTFRASDCLTVSTPALAEGHARECSDVRVLPNFLDWSMWEGVEQQSEVDRGGRVRVGWMGWLVWHPDDLNVLRGLVGPWLDRNPHVDFVSIGEPEPGDEEPGYVSVHDLLEVPADRRFTVRARPFRELGRIVPNIDVGLVPLAGSFFNECKSHLKGLEYSACGIVPVCSPTGPYRSFIRDGETGFLASKPRQWLRVLDLLVNDDELRRTVGRAARVEASRQTIQEHWGLWEQTYSSLLGAREAVAA